VEKSIESVLMSWWVREAFVVALVNTGVSDTPSAAKVDGVLLKRYSHTESLFGTMAVYKEVPRLGR
jgi:hypothetical protein